MYQPVIQAQNLSIAYRIDKVWHHALSGIDLSIFPNQIHGLVGESGSGKSTLGLGIIRYLSANSKITHGEIWFDGEDITKASSKQMRQIWGSQISLVPQNPLDSLNPSLRIGKQMREVTMLHLGLSKAEAQQVARQALENVHIADPDEILKQYPHQLSGGMQQRVMIAMALSTRPKLLILDEPTTALDVTTQAVILDLIRDLVKQGKTAALYVSHDLGTVAQICDYVTVLYSGEVMESGTVDALFGKPQHPYTIGLLKSLPGSVPDASFRLPTISGIAPSLAERSAACVFADRCPAAIEKCHQEKPNLDLIGDQLFIRCWRWQEIIPEHAHMFQSESTQKSEGSREPTQQGSPVLSAKSISKYFDTASLLGRLIGQKNHAVQAVDKVSVDVHQGATVGIVGESGSGKTTLARAIIALTTANHGTLSLNGSPLSLDLNQRKQPVLRALRMVFQNPSDALNPYQSIGNIIGRTYTVLSEHQVSTEELEEKISVALQSVGLAPDYADRYPDQLSGGEKQRVALARAIVANPDLIIADEPTSSLDVSVQATILNLLRDLRTTHGASYILISHDLDVVTYLSDWVMVMYLGEVMEQSPAQSIQNPPMHPYTEALLSAIPVPDPTSKRNRIRLQGEIPSPRNKPMGCPFHTRCPRYIGEICATQTPPDRQGDHQQVIRCHIPLGELIEVQSQHHASGGAS